MAFPTPALKGSLPSPYPLSPRTAGDDMNHVTDGIWIGSHYVLKSSQACLSRNIRHVVNTAIEFITENPELINWEELKRGGIEVHNTFWDDTLNQVIFPSASLETAVKKMDDVLSTGQPILVNCAMGKSRSSTLIIAYLMARKGIGYDEALMTIKRSRPQCQPNANFERQMRQLEQCLRANQGGFASPKRTPAAGFLTNYPANSYAPQAAAPVPTSPQYPAPPTSPQFPGAQGPSSPPYRSFSPQARPAQPNGYTSPTSALAALNLNQTGQYSSPHTVQNAHNRLDLHSNYNTGVPHPGVQHPGVQHPGVQHPGVQHPGVQHPGVQHPGVQHPGVQHPAAQPYKHHGHGHGHGHGHAHQHGHGHVHGHGHGHGHGNVNYNSPYNYNNFYGYGQQQQHLNGNYGAHGNNHQGGGMGRLVSPFRRRLSL